MKISKDEVYSSVQDVFRRGVVIIVGSGASCALGLPGMPALANYLVEHVPGRLAAIIPSCKSEWESIALQLGAGLGLESAMISNPIPDALSEVIAELIAECVSEAEQRAIDNILTNNSPSAFGRLFDHILQTAPVVDVITTNYDRLIEVHAARAGVRVDSMFYGHTIGRFSATFSQEELMHAQTVPGRGRNARLTPRPHVRLSKPHGSLDWFKYQGQHYRSDLPFPGARRIVAPGGNKYRLGYEIPFDAQRTRANTAIDNASAMFFVGYGFNDDHLQTHIHERLPQVPTLVTSRTITENARQFLALNPKAIGIEAATNASRSHVTQGNREVILDLPIWDTEHLVKEVLAK